MMNETRILYLGPPETFTEQAAKALAGRFENIAGLVPCRSLEEVIRGVDGSTFGVVPYYNLYEGLIQETLDLITEHRLFIAAAQRIGVRFAIGGYPAGEAVVFSHPKAIAQCSSYLQEHHFDARRQEVLSTAEGARVVSEQKSGWAIARREALESAKIPVLADDIGNRQYGRSNYTEFLFIAREKPPFSSDSKDRRVMVAILPTVDRVGLLAEILGQISFCGINLQKIHSRPALLDPSEAGPFEHDPQMFYLEMESTVDSPAFRLCMETLNLRLSQIGETSLKPVRILGDYPLFRKD